MNLHQPVLPDPLLPLLLLFLPLAALFKSSGKPLELLAFTQLSPPHPPPLAVCPPRRASRWRANGSRASCSRPDQAWIQSRRNQTQKSRLHLGSRRDSAPGGVWVWLRAAGGGWEQPPRAARRHTGPPPRLNPPHPLHHHPPPPPPHGFRWRGATACNKSLTPGQCCHRGKDNASLLEEVSTRTPAAQPAPVVSLYLLSTLMLSRRLQRPSLYFQRYKHGMLECLDWCHKETYLTL